MTPLRIAYVFYDRPNNTAGPRINAIRILPELARRGHQVTALIGYQERCQAQPLLEAQGVAVRALPWPYFVEAQAAWFGAQLRELDPDIFVPNVSVSACYVARYAREAGRPTIAAHLSDDAFNWGMAERFCKANDAYSVSGLYCVGTELSRVVRSWHPPRTEITEIAPGVSIPARVADQAGPIRMVYAGRLATEQKRILETTDAMLSALERDSEASALLLGDGPERAPVQRLVATHKAGDRCKLRGYVPPDQVQQVMLEGNVLVLLSDYEGVPGAIIDAMACGLIPVCLDVDGGLRELVIEGRTGLLVKNRGEDFQRAIERLRRDPELRARLSRGAREHAEAHFSLVANVDHWEALFERLLERAGTHRPLEIPRHPLLPPPYAALRNEDRRATAAGQALRAYGRARSLRRRLTTWLRRRGDG